MTAASPRRHRLFTTAASSLLALAAIGTAAPAQAIVKGTVVPGGWAGDTVPAVNPYAFVGRMAVGCTASLVAPDLALTAGHCAKTKGTRVWFGVLNADRDAGVERTIVAESNMRDVTFSAGMSTLLVRLNKPIRSIAPVPLARKDQSRLWSGRKRLANLGWGQINDSCIIRGRTVPTAELRRADMKIVDTAVSSGLYRNTAKAASVSGHPAKGDSGGPLLAKDDRGRFVLVGVFQAAVGLCRGNNYAYYYSRVWTQKKLQDFVSANQ